MGVGGWGLGGWGDARVAIHYGALLLISVEFYTNSYNIVPIGVQNTIQNGVFL
jgi:hypothetical protein